MDASRDWPSQVSFEARRCPPARAAAGRSCCAGGAGRRPLRVDLHALEVALHDEVDHPGDGVRAVGRRGPAGQHVDAVDELGGDLVDVGGRIRVARVGVANAEPAAVDQHQGARLAQAAKVDGGDAARTGQRVGGAAQPGLAVLRDLRQRLRMSAVTGRPPRVTSWAVTTCTGLTLVRFGCGMRVPVMTTSETSASGAGAAGAWPPLVGRRAPPGSCLRGRTRQAASAAWIWCSCRSSPDHPVPKGGSIPKFGRTAIGAVLRATIGGFSACQSMRRQTSIRRTMLYYCPCQVCVWGFWRSKPRKHAPGAGPVGGGLVDRPPA